MFIGLSAFKKDLEKFTECVPKRGNAASRRVAKYMFSEVVRLTPKDTGFASSKWSYTINTRPSTNTILNPRNPGPYSPAVTPSFYNFKGGDILYVFNNVAYIPLLENGWSQQAPTNFIKNTVARARYKLQQEFNKIKC